jgi:hypothetical protein
MGGAKLGFSLQGFIELASQGCFLCGRDPQERLVVSRKDGTYELRWNYIVVLRSNEYSTVKLVPMCKTCRLLHRHFDIKALISHCARIMARRMWKVHSKWFIQAQDKPPGPELIIERFNDVPSSEPALRIV